MSWKGSLRTFAAAQRRSERAARQRQNELIKQQKFLDKMAELDRAAYEVNEYENRLELLTSIHKEGIDEINWKVIAETDPPVKPLASHGHEELAKAQLENYKPGIADRLLKRTDIKREELAKAVHEAHQLDEQEFEKALKVYENDLMDWQSTQALAHRVLSNDYEAFIEVIKQINLFSEISELGSAIRLQAASHSLIEAELDVNSDEIIPKEAITLLKSGKLSFREMSKAKINQLYQDHICACVLRIARDLFALLPIDIVIVTAHGKVLNTKTGYLEKRPILSVIIPRATLHSLNFESLDPSDSMDNFVHQMNFKKTVGFNAVEQLFPSDIQAEGPEAISTA